MDGIPYNSFEGNRNACYVWWNDSKRKANLNWVENGNLFGRATDSFIRGKVYFEKGEYAKAASYFNECIANTIRDDEDTQISG